MGLVLDTRTDVLILSGLLFLIVMTRVVMERLGYQFKPPVRKSLKHVGRFDFVLRILLLTAVLVAVVRFVPDGAYAGIARLGGDACVFAVAVFVFRAMNGRLLDAGLAGSHSRWVAFVWLLSTVLLAAPTRLWSLGLVPLSVLLIAGGTIRSKTSTVPSE